MASGSGPPITSYQHYGSTAEGGQFASVAFQQPSITTQPYPSMGGPGPQNPGYQQLGENNDVEDNFDVDCLNRLNRCLLVRCIPPKRRAKHYSFITKLNCVLCVFLCACCALPCLYLARREAKQVKVLNNQRDYLSARSRSYVVATCNIMGFVCIFLSDILIVGVIVGLCIALKYLVSSVKSIV